MERKLSKKVLVRIVFIILVVVGLFLVIYTKFDSTGNQTGTEAAIKNYKEDVDYYAAKYNLPSSYLMALIMLECSGKKNISPRYEKHVYTKLKKFRDHKITRFENLTYEEVENLSDKELKALAKSYGPFQIMGYKSIKLGINVEDLQGKNAIAIGVKWINNEYGDYLRDGRFQDAFHVHNTGKIYPQSGQSETYDPKYVDNGLYYIRYFSNLM